MHVPGDNSQNSGSICGGPADQDGTLSGHLWSHQRTISLSALWFQEGPNCVRWWSKTFNFYIYIINIYIYKHFTIFILQ